MPTRTTILFTIAAFAIAPVFGDREVVRAEIDQRPILRVGDGGQHDAAGSCLQLRLAGRGQRDGDACGEGDNGGDHGSILYVAG